MREARGPRAGPTVSSPAALNRRLRTPSATLLRRRTLCCLRGSVARERREKESTRESPTISRPVIVPYPRLSRELPTKRGIGPGRSFSEKLRRGAANFDTIPRSIPPRRAIASLRSPTPGASSWFAPERNIIRIFIENGRIRGIYYRLYRQQLRRPGILRTRSIV